MENNKERLLNDARLCRRAIKLEKRLEELKVKREDAQNVLGGSAIGAVFYGISSAVLFLCNQPNISAACGIVFIGLGGISTYYGIKEAVLTDDLSKKEKELKLLYSEYEK